MPSITNILGVGFELNLLATDPASSSDGYKLVVEVSSGQVVASKTFLASSVLSSAASPDGSFAHAGGWMTQILPFPTPFTGASPFAKAIVIRIFVEISGLGQCANPLTGLFQNIVLYF